MQITTNSSNAIGSEVNNQLMPGIYLLEAQGTFGSGTLVAQYSLDGGTTWTNVSAFSGAITGTAAFTGTFWVQPGTRYQLKLSGATSPSINVNCSRVQAVK